MKKIGLILKFEIAHLPWRHRNERRIDFAAVRSLATTGAMNLGPQIHTDLRRFCWVQKAEKIDQVPKSSV
jgi:hypothetical protein